LERDIDFPVGMLAIFKADAVYVPLDPSAPQERIAALLDDAQPALVVTRRGLRDLFAGRRCLCIDDDERSDADVAAGDAIDASVSPLAAPQRAAYMIYTSGSTGTPKGVLVPHGAIANLSHATQRRLSIGPGDRVLQFAAQGFDVSVWEMTMALCWGATLYLAPREALLPGPDLHRYLQQYAITRLALTASSLAATPSHDLPALRTVISGGEVCPAELVRRWQPGREFHNVYGPTEAGICTSMDRCEADDGEPTIGTAFANVAVYVLDERLERVPIGAWGELCVGGIGLAHGYWRRPDATAAAFVPNPYSSRPGARLYRTGDRVRLREDGKIEYHSRTDEQIKLRGFRIEPGEIESRLLRDPAVAEAAVAVRALAQGAQQLVAYLVPAADAPLDTEALRRELANHLPGYMVPSALVAIERMPRTANGKIDRAALPMPSAADFTGSAQADRIATPPQTPTEHWLAAMWCGLLGLECIGREDDFFGLGGHSLLATQVVSRVAAEQGVELPVRVLFASPTLAAFASAIDAARDAARHAEDDEAQLIASLEAMSEEEALALLGDEAMAARVLGNELAGGDANLLAAMDR
jgi:amino acid adenylation domain-containing protein